MLADRDWLPAQSAERINAILKTTIGLSPIDSVARIEALARENAEIHTKRCFNLNPATNVMNPRAETMLSAGLGSRPSLGYAGDKYEMGLQAIEEIEVIAADLAARVFDAKYAELRIPSGAIANLYGFMATCAPGDTIIAPDAEVGGHVTHHAAGCAGLFGLKTISAPSDAKGYSIDIDQLARMAREIRPALITVGQSLNLFEHPVADVRAIADEIGAKVMFDAAHQCGIIAGKAWKNPLEEGAHFMTMSTYKSLGGPAGGLIVTNDAEIAERLEAIAFPGMTANFDAGKTAALAISLADWLDHGQAYADEMIATAQAFAEVLTEAGIPLFAAERGVTASHQFAIEAARFGGGQTASKKLELGGFLACGIGLPIAAVDGDNNGLRIGTPELVRFGVNRSNVREIAELSARVLMSNAPESLADETRALRARYQSLHFING
ncbi:aminotransferase class I/II-fold pyridoxal phosphate-dependent enzyme [Martelella alba]|uniref:Aminotransferase class I/II-fold pyridoxal phosphate-dependent enzyme n=1 Tax=Martelella alba TaxID=2590451 RepID=A0A506UGG8_9HYPH|nr:aminotransferase class I/II-fold pyridoxal phosphate-dependent enzyme [Martelella alba]TPW32374.1 aminotransferase class I/II-fold pyridoxal phosphate-dependent enzyme [Martelella alba]